MNAGQAAQFVASAAGMAGSATGNGTSTAPPMGTGTGIAKKFVA